MKKDKWKEKRKYKGGERKWTKKVGRKEEHIRRRKERGKEGKERKNERRICASKLKSRK